MQTEVADTCSICVSDVVVAKIVRAISICTEMIETSELFTDNSSVPLTRWHYSIIMLKVDGYQSARGVRDRKRPLREELSDG